MGLKRIKRLPRDLAGVQHGKEFKILNGIVGIMVHFACSPACYLACAINSLSVYSISLLT